MYKRQDIDLFLSLVSAAAAQKEFFNNPVVDGGVFAEINYGKVPALSRFKFLVIYGAVSYTHLCWNSPRTLVMFDTSSLIVKAAASLPTVLFNREPLLSSSRICLLAVSYTHLAAEAENHRGRGRAQAQNRGTVFHCRG